MLKKGKKLTSKDRSNRISKLSTDYFDLVVIGGGATGAGIALDAAARGLKTALVEKKDFASGTSSKSTKLIHGGLRYLKQLDIGLVRESGTERAIVHNLAPHLCLPEKMLLPLVEGGSFGKYSTSIGLWVYDFIAGVDKSDHRKMLSKSETLAKEPILNEKILKGAGYYAEYRTDDSRLTIEVIKKAADFTALSINYVEVIGFITNKGKVAGVTCLDKLNDEAFEIKAKKIVSAGGPWVDHLRKINDSLNSHFLYLTKGVHIVTPHDRLPIQQAVYFDVPDGRMIFAIPRGKVTYIGTTDTEYKGHKDRVVATEADLEYLLKAVNHMFPNSILTKFDIISNWAGLRSLIYEEGKSPSELSRKDEIFESPNGLISIAGGKLTGYRKMAERIVDKVLNQLCEEENYDFINTSTEKIPLTSEPFKDKEAVEQYTLKVKDLCEAKGLDNYYASYLVSTYGKQTDQIFEILKDTESQSTENKDIEIELALAEASFCIHNEMIQRLDDFFIRRTGRLYFDIQSIDKIRQPVTALMAEKLEWSEKRVKQEESHFDLLIKDATTYYPDEQVQPIELEMKAFS